MKDLYKMNLQLFAEGDEGVENLNPDGEQTGGDNGDGSETGQDSLEGKTYTKEEMEALVQAETDRKVTKALETARQKWQQEEQKKVKQAEELAKLTENERTNREFELQKQAFEEEKQKFEMERLALEAEKILVSKNLSVDFARFLVAVDADQTHENIGAFEKQWQKALEKAVDDKIKGKTPKGNGDGKGLAGKKIKDMTSDERIRFKHENPALYEQMRNAEINK